MLIALGIFELQSQFLLFLAVVFIGFTLEEHYRIVITGETEMKQSS